MSRCGHVEKKSVPHSTPTVVSVSVSPMGTTPRVYLRGSSAASSEGERVRSVWVCARKTAEARRQR